MSVTRPPTCAPWRWDIMQSDPGKRPVKKSSESLDGSRPWKPRSTPSRSFWASRLSKPRRQPTGRSAGGGDLPPLHGIHSLSKRTSTWSVRQPLWVSMPWQGAYPRLDAPAIDRMRAAGAIPIGEPTVPTSPFAGTPNSELKRL